MSWQNFGGNSRTSPVVSKVRHEILGQNIFFPTMLLKLKLNNVVAQPQQLVLNINSCCCCCSCLNTRPHARRITVYRVFQKGTENKPTKKSTSRTKIKTLWNKIMNNNQPDTPRTCAKLWRKIERLGNQWDENGNNNNNNIIWYYMHDYELTEHTNNNK